MAIVDAGIPSSSDEDVLGVVGHSDHFVGDDLSDRQDQIVSPLGDDAIDLGWPRFRVDPFGRLRHKFLIDITEGIDIGAESMDADQVSR